MYESFWSFRNLIRSMQKLIKILSSATSNQMQQNLNFLRWRLKEVERKTASFFITSNLVKDGRIFYLMIFILWTEKEEEKLPRKFIQRETHQSLGDVKYALIKISHSQTFLRLFVQNGKHCLISCKIKNMLIDWRMDWIPLRALKTFKISKISL